MKLVVLAALTFALAACLARKSTLAVYYDVPEFQLIAQDGQPFDSKVLAGKIWVADFIYTSCPGPCPRMTSQMREVQDAIKSMPDIKLSPHRGSRARHAAGAGRVCQAASGIPTHCISYRIAGHAAEAGSGYIQAR